MNKIFKKVFNAARGMMMVVNETTSSVQTGKKAAVTVAVIGALASTSVLGATEYKNQDSDTDGGALTVTNGETATVKDAVFESNKVNKAGSWGGAIWNKGTLTVSGSTFDKNQTNTEDHDDTYGNSGGAIGSGTGSSLNIVDSTFTNNVAFNDGGAIGSFGALNITGSHFESNSASTDDQDKNPIGGGAIAFGAETNANVSSVLDTTFTKNTSGTNGGAIATRKAKDATLVSASYKIDATFTENKAEQSGGAIWNSFYADYGEEKGTGVLVSGKFIKNEAKNNGGAIYNDGWSKDTNDSVSGGLMTVSGEFVENKADWGGAIFNKGTMTIADSTFEGNTASSVGGAITTFTATSVTSIKNSAFKNNVADADGGAIGNYAAMTIESSTFEGNRAYEGYKAGNGDNSPLGGGAIALGSVSETEVQKIVDSNFVNNYSGYNGGAIATRMAANLDGAKNSNKGKLAVSATFQGNEAARYGGAIYNTFYTDHGSVIGEGVTITGTFDTNKALSGGAIYNDGAKDANDKGGVMTITDTTFTGNSAAEQGGAIYNSGDLTLNGTNTFSGNMAGDVANDIHNVGTLKIDGTTTLGSGIVNEGMLKLVGETEVVLGGDSEIGGTFLTDKGAVLTLQDGATVSLDSKTDDTTNAGVIKNLTIQGQGDVMIAPTQTARALGIGVNTLDVGSVTIDIDGTNAKAVTAYGLNTIKADAITIDSEGDGIHAMGDANGKVTLTGGDVSIQGGLGGYAIQNAAGNGEETIVVTGKTVSLTSLGRTAISQQGDSSMRIEADDLTIEGFKDKYDSKVNAVNVTAGTLSLVGTKSVMISNGQGGADTNAIGVEAGGALSITGGNATVSGTTLVGGQLDMTADYNTLDALVLTGNAQVSLDGVNKIKSIDYQAPKMRLFALRSTGPVLNLGGTTVIEDDTNAPTLNVEGDITHGGNVNVDNYNANGANVALNGSDNDLGNFNGNDSSITLAAGSDTQIGGFSGDNNTINLPDTETTITVTDDSATNTTVNAPGSVTDQLGGDMSQLKNQVQGLAGTFKGESGDVFGESTTVIDGKGNVISQIVEKHETNTQLAELTSTVPTLLARAEANDLRKRMGDIRAAEGTHGVWARYDGGKLSGATGLDYDFNKLQIGIDTVPAEGEPRLGVAFTYGKGDTEMARGASAENESFSLAAYGMWLNDNGQFVDVIARLSTTSTDLTTRTYNQSIDQLVASVSGEYGWRLPVNDMAFVEPSVELSYTHVTGETFVANRNTFEIDAYDSLVGRVGVAGGLTCPNNKGQMYVRAGVAHEFMGDSKFMATSAAGYSARPIENDGKDTWFEYAIGGQYNVNKNTYVYADVERTAGGDLDQDWRASVGVRYSF